MGVHLLGQLAGDLDGLHLRREGSAEYPLDEVLDPLLQVSQNADAKAPYVMQDARSPARAMPMPCEGRDNPKATAVSLLIKA
jgi:hypothetical protein